MSHISRVVRPFIAFDANTGGNVQPLYRVSELLDEVQNCCPQVHMFSCTGRVLPFVSAPPLCST